jgi:hypothetical protein
VSGVLAAVVFFLFAGTRDARPQPMSEGRMESRPATDLDAFMERVLARREVNRQTLNDYVLDEVEAFEILGPGKTPLHRSRREFTWYVRDGMHVRSPVRFNGVDVEQRGRDEYEAKWMRRERRRRENKEKRQSTVSVTGADVGPGGLPTEPRFVSEAYFMDFKFEPGNYLLAGRESLEGHDVLRIEYYPTRLFSDRDEDEPSAGEQSSRRRTRHREDDDREDEEIERRMNKTALVTLWIDPAQHQIVKYSFDNVWLDFLPGAWLVRVDALRASMTMGQPFPGIWLPRGIDIRGGATLANGSYEIGLSREFTGYREAQVTTTIRVPKTPGAPPPGPPREEPRVPESPDATGPGGPRSDDGRAQTISPEIVREVRVHGNAFVADEDVLRIAAVGVGTPIGPDTLQSARDRLTRSGLFETVDVRKRYRSLEDPGDVALVLLVHERPGVTSATSATDPVTGTFRRLREHILFLPILSYTDGYGFTYGARVSTVDALGGGERFSLPLTWGGTRRAAFEFEQPLRGGPLTRLTSSVAIWQRENPRFDVDDRRLELKAGAERQLGRMFRLGMEASRSRVEFADLDDRTWTIGATGAVDTRLDPAFPRNAVYLGAGWSALHVNGDPGIDRYYADGRGYLGVIGQSVLAGRAQYFTADATLPPYERLLAGGAATLRGFRAGSFDGDRMLVTSMELRVPITSVISGAKLGATVFLDAAKVANAGDRLSAADWQRGAGAGLFLIASVLRVNLDVARGLEGGGTRVHLASGFSF